MASLVGVDAEHLCTWCACVFKAPLGRTHTCNMFCSPECRLERRRETNRRSQSARERTPARIVYNRERNRAWRMAHRGATGRSSPWLLGAPAYGPTLPCVELDVAFSPAPKWPIRLRNMRGVHGAVSALLGESVGIHHRKHTPTFAARLHEATTVRVVVWDERAADLLDKTFHGALWDRPTKFYVDVDAPCAPERRGRTRVRLSTITPVVISKDGHSRAEVRPCKTTIERSLSGGFLDRVGLGSMASIVKADVTHIRTKPAHVHIGGKFGTVSGWFGDLDLEVNAPALWLLRCAEKVGLGSRIGFGFGRVVVEVLDA
jgi:hypothetical protein